MGDTDGSEMHFVEDATPEAIRDVIAACAPAVSVQLSRPGGGFTNCVSACAYWMQALREAEFGASMLTGYYADDPLRAEHHWLVVGSEMVLFDPTAGQFLDRGVSSVGVDGYVVRVLDPARGRGSFVDHAFLAWRESMRDTASSLVTAQAAPQESDVMRRVRERRVVG